VIALGAIVLVERKADPAGDWRRVIKARVLAGLKHEYPRMRDLPGPGFAAGPCLMKDTMQLAAFDSGGFALGNTAMRINEGLPSFLVDQVAEHHDAGQRR